tara:strand:+ start:69377 stop:69814 length:438 start_codon:yes stop_codon:yes gene_type:complete
LDGRQGADRLTCQIREHVVLDPPPQFIALSAAIQSGEPVRLILVLVLTGLLAVLALPGAAVAHGASDVAMLDHMPGCADCSEASGAPSIDHDCPHVTGCGAMVTVSPAMWPATIAPQSQTHDRAGANLLNGIPSRIDLPPPRSAA